MKKKQLYCFKYLSPGHNFVEDLEEVFKMLSEHFKKKGSASDLRIEISHGMVNYQVVSIKFLYEITPSVNWRRHVLKVSGDNMRMIVHLEHIGLIEIDEGTGPIPQGCKEVEYRLAKQHEPSGEE